MSEHRDKKVLEKVNKVSFTIFFVFSKLAEKIEIEKTKRENERKSYWSLEKAEEERQMGNECFKKGSFPDAVKHYNEGIKRTPDNEKVCNYRLIVSQIPELFLFEHW